MCEFKESKRSGETNFGDEPASQTNSLQTELQIPNSNSELESQLQSIESSLDLFSNQYMNKHMIYSIIELIIVRLVPEIQHKSVRNLLDDRLGTEWKDEQLVG